MTEQPAAYYDAIYGKQIAGQSPESAQWDSERLAAVLPHIVGSVFDIGCGLGRIADYVDDDYLGVDFSQAAIDYAREHTSNPRAMFVCGDALMVTVFDKLAFDTVLLLEVLEHVNLFAPFVTLAQQMARRRIVITVPRDMPGRAHVHPRWEQRDIERLFGKLSVCRLFGGPEEDRWWLAVKDA